MLFLHWRRSIISWHTWYSSAIAWHMNMEPCPQQDSAAAASTSGEYFDHLEEYVAVYIHPGCSITRSGKKKGVRDGRD